MTTGESLARAREARVSNLLKVRDTKAKDVVEIVQQSIATSSQPRRLFYSFGSRRLIGTVNKCMHAL